MASIHLTRPHTLGLAKARNIAATWAEQVERDYDLQCTYEEGDDRDCVKFSRSGVTGTLWVSATNFDMSAELGFLLSAFKGRIEHEIVSHLDTLLNNTSGMKS